MPVLSRALAALLVLALLPTACGGDDDDDAEDGTGPTTTEVRAPRVPPGWRTVRNPVLGVTVAAPRGWPAEIRRQATLIRSDDQLVSITVAADRSAGGRRLSPARYARRTLRSLPGLEGKVAPRARRVRGSPYPSAIVEARGTVSSTTRPQLISVAVFRQGDQAMLTAIVFRNARVTPHFNDRTIRRMLGTLRGQTARE